MCATLIEQNSLYTTGFLGEKATGSFNFNPIMCAAKKIHSKLAGVGSILQATLCHYWILQDH